jgi:outer membrane protein TolC
MSARRALTGAALLALAGCTSVPGEDAGARDAARTQARGGFAVEANPRSIERAASDDPATERALASGATLEAVREAAIRRNPDLAAALERWVAALERAPQASAPPDPWLRNDYQSMFRMYMVELVQDVPFPTKLLAEGRAALAEARAAGADFAERRNLLRAEADAAVAALYFARREREITLETLRVLDRFVETARAKIEAGTGSAPQADLLRAESERAALRAEHEVHMHAVPAAESALNALLDRPPQAPIGPLAPLPRPTTASAEEADLARALEDRPDVRGAEERVAAADAMLSSARAGWVPDFSIGGGYVRDLANDANHFVVDVGVTVPLWWGRIDARIAEAEADARRKRAELRAARDRTIDEAFGARERLDAAAARWRRLSEEAVPRAEESLRASEAAYMAGKLDFLALLDAERMLLDRRLDAERALADAVMKRAELERAIGKGGER